MSTLRTIQYRGECESCDGTGIYIGFAEKDGAGVVCNRCKGTGAQELTLKYRDFDGRKHRKGIKRVYQTNPGIGIGSDQERGLRLEDFGGIPYEKWKRGEPFKIGDEMRGYTCPAWFYQCADYNKKPDWSECNAALGRSFSRCPHFEKKAKCWERFDAEQSKKKAKT